jgi:putative PIN family toxin of toxin-antitoxin system
MRLFLDTNVWISAHVARGLSSELLRLLLLGQANQACSLLTAPQVRREALRILRGKLGADAAQLSLFEDSLSAAEMVDDGDPTTLEVPIPDPDDAPLIAAALAAGADAFVTGDQALLDLGQVEGMALLTPRAAYLRLRGLA